ncbi:serine/threonine-protein kinase [Rhodococcus koreensis]|uniref:serine/threonine-protein kinase n=1 Tax=Rhodococcus koreensis TaxID=99653 RepID=UPI00197EFC64|nr:serine/threonine-protein kinase [Rhodococcus koreensis]QSE85746.1 protein kinase [Rhodococcus koreensis]
MAEIDPLTTQRDPTPGIESELAGAGFEGAHEIGRGGFGIVYRCRQPVLDRTVAIKVLTADLDPDNLERFLREQRAMGALSGHPNIVNILQVGTTPSGRPYIVMPYHSRDSLEARIRRSGPLEWSEALGIGIKVAGALEAAHRIGTLHRDVKPANILITDYGEPQLTDFGIARIAGGFETTAGTVTGSPAFTAPEVLEGRSATAASDVYGLGATLFCAITGHAAFERRSGEQVVAQFLRITTQPVPDLRGEGIPEDVSAGIETAMARSPADRPAAPAEFGENLRMLQQRHGLIADDLPLPPDPTVAPDDEPPGRSASRRSTSGRYSAQRRSGARAPTPPAPETRFRPPTPPRTLVHRGRLLDLLRAGQRRRLSVIHAPTGFGKTTLATQWSEVLAGEGLAVAWLTVDRDDNNVVWFLGHLLEAIRRVRPALAEDLKQALEQHGDEADRYVLTALINEIHAAGERVVLVIDDWHRIGAAATLAAMEFLLDNACHHLQVVVTTQSRFGLPVSRMRVRDDVVEIDSTDLRFDPAEAHALLVDLGGLPLEQDDVDELTATTEGWAAGLQLASLSLRDSDDPAQLIESLSGRHRAIGDYLTENVLNTLDPDMLDFLLATSVAERLHGDLAAALAHVDHGQIMLERAEEQDLFLRAIDDNREWFRYHPLFAQCLQQRLEREHPERITELHRAASEWFADRKLISEAVDHALAAADQDRAVELVERDGTYLLEHTQMSTLLGLVAKLPPRIVLSRPRLQLAVAWANILLHRAEPTQKALELVESTLDAESATADEIAELRAEADVVKAAVACRADRVEGIDELVAAALARPDSFRPFVVSSAAGTATFAAIYRFDFAEALRRQQWAAPYNARNIGPNGAMTGHCLVGIVANERLDIHQAQDSFRTALRIARRSGGSHSFSARLAGSLLGELLSEQGRLDEAERLLDESCKLGAGSGMVDFKLARYAAGARIKALRGDRTTAAHRLDEGARAAASLHLPRLRARIENERIRLGLPPTAGLEPPPLAEYTTRRRPVDGVDAITAQLEEDTAIRLLAAADSPASTRIACTWAQEWVTMLDGSRRRRALLQAKRLLIVALAAAERTTEAKGLLAAVTTQCAELGMTRYLLDSPIRVRELVADLRDDSLAGRCLPEWAPVPTSFLTDMLATNTTVDVA